MGVQVATSDELTAGLAALSARVARLETAQPGPTPVPPPTPVPADFWPSGGNPNNNTQSGAEEFGRWRGRKCMVALHYPTRTAGWGPLVSVPGYWTDKAVKLIVQIPFFPQGGDTYANALTSGTVYANWRQLGKNWKAREDAGFVRPVFCCGWEMNHFKLHYWSGPSASPQNYHSYDEFTGVYRRFVKAVRETYPEAEFGLIGNGHDSPGFVVGEFPANDPRNIYPGRDYVDYIGVDYYDHYPPSFGGTSTSSRRKDFDVESREVNGIRWYMEWAKAEGKRFLVPEWACNSGNVAGGDHGGDNPTFVANMFRVFQEAHAAGVMGGECYYEDAAQKMGVMNGQNPRAAAEYLRLWRPS